MAATKVEKKKALGRQGRKKVWRENAVRPPRPGVAWDTTPLKPKKKKAKGGWQEGMAFAKTGRTLVEKKKKEKKGQKRGAPALRAYPKRPGN